MKVSNNSAADQTVSSSHVHSAKSGTKVSKTEQSGDSNKAAQTAPIESDARPEISAKGRELAQAKEVASNAPDVREEKIAKLKEMISAGKYKVDSHAVADRMVDEHLSSGIG
jgi:flagellar biosynthesis anti-sigma factor FlgM